MAVKEKYHEHTKAHLCNSQFGPRHRKADHIIAILLELDIIFAIPMIFHHLGPNCSPVATSVQNTPSDEKSKMMKKWAKIISFLRFFGGTHFCVRHDAENQFFLHFFRGQQHPVAGIEYFFKSLGFGQYDTGVA